MLWGIVQFESHFFLTWLSMFWTCFSYSTIQLMPCQPFPLECFGFGQVDNSMNSERSLSSLWQIFLNMKHPGGQLGRAADSKDFPSSIEKNYQLANSWLEEKVWVGCFLSFQSAPPHCFIGRFNRTPCSQHFYLLETKSRNGQDGRWIRCTLFIYATWKSFYNF